MALWVELVLLVGMVVSAVQEVLEMAVTQLMAVTVELVELVVQLLVEV